jgi:hypothetical protein
VLVDRAGELVRLTEGFRAVADWELLADEVLCFPTKGAAEAAALRLRRRKYGPWRAIPHPRSGRAQARAVLNGASSDRWHALLLRVL